jgi:predicted nucleic-acid-binding protein
MIGVDTDVLLRLFLDDDPTQSKRAAQLMTEAAASGGICINVAVLAEFVWTLTRKLKQSRQRIAALLDDLLVADDDISVMEHAAVLRAVAAYRLGKAGFVDYLIDEINLEHGCLSTATFDVSAVQHPRLVMVP